MQAALRFAAESDVVVVAAAGNAGVGSCAPAGREPLDQVAIPGWYGADLLTVGAVGPNDAPAAFTVPGSWVDRGRLRRRRQPPAAQHPPTRC